MQTKLSIGLVLGLIVLPGLVLFTANPAKAQYRDSHYYCDHRARESTARYTERDHVGNTIGNAAGGAAIGAIIGAIAGDAGKGAGIGAALGAIGGGIEREKDRNSFYRSEYDRCMYRNSYR